MLQILFIVFLLSYAGLLVWNIHGPINLKIDESYEMTARWFDLDQVKFDKTAIRLVKEYVENQTQPEFRPFRILYHQLWYNAITEGYDLQLWLRPRDGGSPQYGLYFKDDLIFLRIEYKGKNRVLKSSFQVKKLIQYLDGHAL